MTFELILLIIGLILSGFFSSSETALFSISKIKALHIAKDGSKTGQLILEMKEDSHTLLTTILIGNNLVNIASSALATSLAISYFKSNAVGIATGIMTILILIFGEIFPKSIATRNNVLIARLVILPLYWLSFLFAPIIFMLNFIPKLTGKMQIKAHVTEEELMTFVEVVEEEGGIEEDEKELIENIFEFDDTSATEIMTPRADMYVISVDEDLNLEEVIRSGYTRIPVIEEDIDHVIGILNIKDLFLHQVTSSEAADVRKIMSEPYYVPENLKLDNLLQQFKKRKQHIAIIVDEHGGVSGLITLEDALEELVGEIVDESDKFEPHIVKLNKDEWRVLGKSEIDEVNEEIQMRIPDSREYDTFSGYILDKIGRIPQEKEKISLGDYMVTVYEMDGNRIKEYIVKKQADLPQEAQS